MSEEIKRTLQILENHVTDFSIFKEKVGIHNEKVILYQHKGLQSMEKIDALYTGQLQAAKYLANLEALPQIAEKFQSIKADLLPAAMAQNHVPVNTMNEALKSQAKILGIVIAVLLTLLVSLFGAFVAIKFWIPEFFKP